MNSLWLQSAGCGICTMSLLCAESPGVFDLLKGAGLSFLWHPSLSEMTGAPPAVGHRGGRGTPGYPVC